MPAVATDGAGVTVFVGDTEGGPANMNRIAENVRIVSRPSPTTPTMTKIHTSIHGDGLRAVGDTAFGRVAGPPVKVVAAWVGHAGEGVGGRYTGAGAGVGCGGLVGAGVVGGGVTGDGNLTVRGGSAGIATGVALRDRSKVGANASQKL